MHKNNKLNEAQPIPTELHPREAKASREKAQADLAAEQPDTAEEIDKILEENQIKEEDECSEAPL